MFHICLIPFCIIDMNLAVFFKQLNNLLLCTLTQLVPGEDKNHNHTLFFFSRRRRLGFASEEAQGLFCFFVDQLCFFLGFFNGPHAFETSKVIYLQRIYWSQPKVCSHMQPSPAVLQHGAMCESQAKGNLHRPFSTCSLAGWHYMDRGGLLVTIWPVGYFQSCCTIPVADWAWKQADFLSFIFHFFIPLCLRSNFMKVLFLNRSLRLVPRTVPYLILVVDPQLFVRLNEHICSYEWGNCFF